MQINIQSDSIDRALFALKQKYPGLIEDPNYQLFGYLGPTTPARFLEHAFEHEYNCKIIDNNEFGLQGHIVFTEGKYETAFLLRFGGNDRLQQRQQK